MDTSSWSSLNAIFKELCRVGWSTRIKVRLVNFLVFTSSSRLNSCACHRHHWDDDPSGSPQRRHESSGNPQRQEPNTLVTQPFYYWNYNLKCNMFRKLFLDVFGVSLGAFRTSLSAFTRTSLSVFMVISLRADNPACRVFV